MNKIKLIAIFLIVVIPVIYVFSTLYIALNIHLYLPAADLITRWDTLYSSYKDGLSYEVFVPHNLFHWIVVPKVILGLDMIWMNGNGWFIKGLSIFFWLSTLLIVVLAIRKTPHISVFKKNILALLAVALLGGPWIRESLNSPISQYSMICFFLVFAAYYISFKGRSLKTNAIASSSLLMLLMSSGQFIALLPALILSRFRKNTSIFLAAFLFIVTLYVVLEFSLVVVLKQSPLMFNLYERIVDAEMMNAVRQYFSADPLAFLIHFFSSISFFLAKFSFPQIFDWATEWQLKSLSVLLYGFLGWVLLKHKFDWKGNRFWLICLVFSFATALLPAFLRLADGYGNRFSNLGVLLQISSCMFFVLYRDGKYSSWVIALLTAYLLIIFPHTYQTIEKENHSLLGASAVKPQVAYSVGIRDPDIIVNVPGAWWRELDSQAIYAFSPLWKLHGLGVYSSRNYKIFSGQISLPEEVKQCDYQIEHQFWRLWDQEAEVLLYLRGSTHAANEYLSDLVIYDNYSGQPVGRAIKDIAKPLADLIIKPDSWDGFVKLNEFKETQLKLVAYGKKFRCQPIVIDVHP